MTHRAKNPLTLLALSLAPPGLALLSACTVGPDYAAPPPVETPAAWASKPEAGLVPTHPDAALRAWWTTLADPMLDSLVERALAGNLDLREAAARIDEARANRGVVNSGLFPQVDATSAYQRSRASAASGSTGAGFNAPGAERDLFSAGFDATWEIDFFGRIRRGVEAADAQIDSAQDSYQSVRVSLLAEVGRNYVELRSFQRRIEIARSNVAAQEDTLALVRSRRDAGLTNDLDLVRAEANLATTRSQIPLLDAGVRQSAHRLGVLLGRPPGTLLDELAATRPIPPTPPQVPIGLPSDLLERRPDVRAAERDVAAASARIGAATADLFPRFSFTGSFGFSSRDIDDLPEANSRFWSFGPALRWPILEWGRIRQNIKVQDARFDQAMARFEKAVLTSFEDVENAMTNYARERDRRDELVRVVASTQRSVDLSRDLYSQGLADFLSVLDAQRQLFQQQDLLVQSDRSVTANLIALYKALGGGWDSSAPSLSNSSPSPSSHAPTPSTHQLGTGS